MKKNNISAPVPRADGREKAGGKARYIDDYRDEGFLTARFYRAPFSRGTITSLSLPDLPKGYYAVDLNDVPGENHIALINKDWPCFSGKEIRYAGQIILILAGPDSFVVDSLLSQIELEYDEEEPAVTLEDSLALKGGAVAGDDNILAEYHLKKGTPESVFEEDLTVVEGTYTTGFQEQLYLEPQGLRAWVEKAAPAAGPEGGRDKVVIQGTMQCPFYVKHAVEEVLGPGYDVRVRQTVTGGGFGGKEDYPEIMGCPLAVAALKTGQPVKMVFDRSEDLPFTSKRHPSRTVIRTAHREDGSIAAMDYDMTLNGGAYESYSSIVLQRAIFTSNGVYNIPHVHVHGIAMATNTVPSGAFRGFGAPQAIFAIEAHMDRCAEKLKINPLALRRAHLIKRGDPTITGGTIKDKLVLEEMIEKALEVSGYREKRARYGKDSHRGIGISLFNHGCGFTGDGEKKLIKGRARLVKTKEGRVEIHTAIVDMGQGPRTTFRKIVSACLDIERERIDFVEPDTDRVPDSGPTVASRTIMVVGYLIEQAAKELKAKWRDGAAQETEAVYEQPPGIEWDQETLTGDAYSTFGWGVNVVEVSYDPVTYELRVEDVWGVYDVGIPIDIKVVHGQIQGGMSQSLGFGCLEKLETGQDGRFRQKSLADYIVPTSLDFPRTHADTLDNPYEYGPYGAKGMGEMVHNGGHPALAAAVSQAAGVPCNDVPVTPENIMRSLCET